MAIHKRPKVALIGCGGTISSLGSDSLDLVDYPEFGKKLGLELVIERVPEVHQIADIVQVPFKTASSAALDIADLLAIRAIVHEAFLDSDLNGVVILHGTGSLEETAFFLHLTVNDARPVVLVGSQRPLNAVSSDAPMNLINAVRVASSPHSINRGGLIVLNDEINSARDTVKSSNYRLQTFQSASYGILGQVDADRVVYARQIEGKHTVNSPFSRVGNRYGSIRVDILYSFIGVDDVLIKASLAAGACGLVYASFPPGLLSPPVKTTLVKQASEDFPIVVTSRASSGRIVHRRWLHENGLLAGEDFSPQKARIILLLGLMLGWHRTDFQITLPLI
jgi:L-asparaginase